MNQLGRQAATNEESSADKIKMENKRNEQRSGGERGVPRGKLPQNHSNPRPGGGPQKPQHREDKGFERHRGDRSRDHMNIKAHDNDGEMQDEEKVEKKFTGRCRLFVGNLPNDTSEEDFKKMFEKFGEFTEVYVNTSRGFGFVRMDTRQNAEAAKTALDGTMKKGRMLRLRFATHGAALKIKYLHATVTNELLEKAFAQFGEIERAVVIVDDRGKPTGEGIVEFSRKPGAAAALKRIQEGVFLMSACPRPIFAEPLEQKDETDGYPEKFVVKNQEFAKEREQPPRLAEPGTFEYEYGLKWKQLYQRQIEEQRNLEHQFEESVQKMDMEMANAYMEHQTAMLRQDLMRRQEELRRLEEQHSMEMQRRMEMRRQEDERRRMEDERRGLGGRGGMDSMDQRRQQELFAQGMGGSGGGMGGGQNVPSSMASAAGSMGGSSGMRQSRFDQPPGFQAGGSMGNGAGMGNMRSMAAAAGMMGGSMGNVQRGSMGGGDRQAMQMERGMERGMDRGNMERGGMERGMERNASSMERANMERNQEHMRGSTEEFFDSKRARRF